MKNMIQKIHVQPQLHTHESIVLMIPMYPLRVAVGIVYLSQLQELLLKVGEEN